MLSKQGVKEAQYTLGSCYREGNGVPRCEQQAARWLCLAAANGHAEAQALLGGPRQRS